MLRGKTGAYLNEVPFKYFTKGWAPGLANKHKIRLQKVANDKHSNLLQATAVKSFITVALFTDVCHSISE
jgi:hypothetical protein